MTKIADTIRNYLLCKLNYHKQDLDKTINYAGTLKATCKYCDKSIASLPCGRWMLS